MGNEKVVKAEVVEKEIGLPVTSVRTHVSTQIGALGTSINAEKHGVKMLLRADLGGVLVEAALNGKMRKYIVPFPIVAHVELA